MNKLLFIFLFVFICGAVKLSAQINLVPNPSFEVYDTCPNTLPDPGLIRHAIPWFQPDTCFGDTSNSSSTDYYNACSTSYDGVPYNIAGYQYARTGNAYAGLGFLAGLTNNLKEYLEVRLIQPLEPGKMYCVEFYVVLSDLGGFPSLTTDAFHFAFSDSIVYNNCGLPLLLQPAVFNPIGQLISDTLNWTRISGKYVAHGGEQYILIGNFYDNSNCLIDSTGSPAFDLAYYFVDDVSVKLCEGTVAAPNVFTPNGDNTNDFFVVQDEGIKNYSCRIFNRWGNEVAIITNNDEGWNGKNKDDNDCPDGIYYYFLSGIDYNEKEYNLKGFVQLMR